MGLAPPEDSVAWSSIPEAEQQEAFNIISELFLIRPITRKEKRGAT